MIPVGATVYIAPGVENVKYLQAQIRAGALLLSSYMMGKITRYTNGQDKVGIEFEYQVWTKRTDGEGPSNHGTGKPKFCAYIPIEYVKLIPETKVDYFRDNIACKIVDIHNKGYLVTKRLVPTQKDMLQRWEQNPSLDTKGNVELPEVPLDFSDTYKAKGKEWKSVILDGSPTYSPAIDYYKKLKMEEERKANQERLQNIASQYPGYRIGYDPYKALSEEAAGLKPGVYSVFQGRPSNGKTEAAMFQPSWLSRPDVYGYVDMKPRNAGKTQAINAMNEYLNDMGARMNSLSGIPRERSGEEALWYDNYYQREQSDMAIAARMQAYALYHQHALGIQLMYGTSGRPFSFSEPPTDTEYLLLTI